MASAMVIWTGCLLVLLIGTSIAQDANCDYQTDVAVGTTHNIRSPNYPSNYPPGKQCRWMFYCPQGYKCRLDCPEIRIPQSQSCSVDRLLISRSGDPYLNAAERYCDTGSLSNIQSMDNTMSIALISGASSRGGRFACTLRAVQSTPNPGSCSCGYKKTNRIVGGVETGVNEYPMMAGLVDVYESRIKCGAVIISDRYVMTAAHCVAGKADSIRAVVVGEHDVTVGDSPATRVYTIQNTIIHPQYSSQTNNNDIALVRTTEPIQFSDRVGPACLPFKFANSDLSGRTVTALGWGTQFIGGPTSNYLQKVNLNVLSQSQCQSTNPSFLSPQQMCTYTPGKDACQDDSGGPLLLSDNSNGLEYSVGIISYGILCATGGKPGMNTRVTSYLSWIQANTNGYQFCNK